MTEADLLALARAVSGHAYAPYSKVRVGAALLADNGEVVTGANVENASYGLTLCAERVALAAAVARGLTRFSTLAVYGAGGVLPYPCGACLQVAWELAPSLKVVVSAEGGGIRSHALRELLPHAFSLASGA